MRDEYVTVVLANGRELTMTIPTADAVELANLAAGGDEGGGVFTAENEDDFRSYTIRGENIVAVFRPAALASWVLRVEVNDPLELRDKGLYDEDGVAEHKPEWTREPEVLPQYGVSIYARGLASRAPGWMQTLAATLAKHNIRHEIQNLGAAA